MLLTFIGLLTFSVSNTKYRILCTKVKSLMFIKLLRKSLHPSQLHSLLNLEWLSCFEHTVQSLLDMCLLGIRS